MANLSGVRITNMGRNSSGLEFAIVQGRVSWSSREIQENLTYTVKAFLRERDDSRDDWSALPNGDVVRAEKRGNADDIVGRNRVGGIIGTTFLRPSGQSSRSFSIRGDFDFGNQESGNEEYYAVVTVVPDIKGDLEITPEFRPINLG